MIFWRNYKVSKKRPVSNEVAQIACMYPGCGQNAQ